MNIWGEEVRLGEHCHFGSGCHGGLLGDVPGYAAHSPEAGHTLLIFYTFIHKGMFAPGWERIGPERTFTASALARNPCTAWEWTGTQVTRMPTGYSDLEMTDLSWVGKGVSEKVWGVFSNILQTRDSAGILWLS